MRSTRALILLAVLVLPACGDLLDPAAAVVRGKKITIDEVQVEVDAFEASDEFARLAAQGDADAIKRQFEQTVLTELIRGAVLEPEAERLDVAVTDADVVEQIEVIKADFASESAFEEVLNEQGLTLEQLTDLVYLQLLEDRVRAEIVAQVAPSEDAVRQAYDGDPERFRQTRASHILVPKKSLAGRISRQLGAEDGRARTRLFRRLAEKFSDDQSNAELGGDLGYYSPGDFVPAFEEAAEALDVGAVSEPVKTDFGFHVIMVTDRRAQSFADVRDQLFDELAAGAQDSAWREWLEDAYESAEVEVNPRYGEFDLAAQQVLDPAPSTVPGVGEVQATPDADPGG